MSDELYTSVQKKDDDPANPELKKICKQLRDIRKRLADDKANEKDPYELAKIKSLDDRALEVMAKVGCAGVPLLDRNTNEFIASLGFTK